MSKRRRSLFWGGKPPREILRQPPAQGIRLRDVEPGAQLAYQQVDDERIVRNDDGPVDVLWWIGGGGLAIGFTVCLLNEFPTGFEAVVFYLFLVLPCVLLILYILFLRPTGKELIFDRKYQTVTIPGALWARSGTVPFTEAVASQSSAPVGIAGVRTWLALGAKGIFGSADISIGPCANSVEQEAAWSFWVWYMDKNRPLPPCEALDAYRARDQARRAAEGHPPPLYYSHIHPDNPGPAPADLHESGADCTEEGAIGK